MRCGLPVVRCLEVPIERGGVEPVPAPENPLPSSIMGLQKVRQAFYVDADVGRSHGGRCVSVSIRHPIVRRRLRMQGAGVLTKSSSFVLSPAVGISPPPGGGLGGRMGSSGAYWTSTAAVVGGMVEETTRKENKRVAVTLPAELQKGRGGMLATMIWNEQKS